MDVIRDRAIVELNANQVKVLDTNLQATSDRFEIGDLTRTDVAQSEARLELARSQLAIAQGNRATARRSTASRRKPPAARAAAAAPPLPASDENGQIALQTTHSSQCRARDSRRL